MTITNNVTHDQFLVMVNQLTAANKAYYNNLPPIMSDTEYDYLFDKVQILVDMFGWTEADTLLNFVAGGAHSAEKTVKHSAPMLSLGKVNSDDELVNFLGKNLGANFVLEPKLDGAAVSVVYVKGEMVRIVTRGDGETGEDITARVGVVSGLPKKLAVDADIEVRGEIFMNSEDFRKSNEARIAFEYARWLRRKERSKTKIEPFDEEKAGFKNPRNAVAGVLRNEKNDYATFMTFGCYDVLLKGVQISDSYLKNIKFVEQLGFSSAHSLIPNKVLQETDLLKQIASFGDIRNKKLLSYPTDGVVIKLDSLKEREILGSNSRSPRWAVAYKFPSDMVETVLREIIIDVGRTGRLSFRGRLDPVQVDGSKITYLTLHNADWVMQKNISLPTVAIIRKANDVIPYMEEIVHTSLFAEATKWVAPTACPQCDGPLDKRTLLWRCPNPECVVVGKLVYAVTRDVLDVEFLSDKLVKMLHKNGLVNDIADLFDLTVNQIASTPTGETKNDGTKSVIGVTTAKKIVAEIQKAKKQPLSRIITALGLRGTGRSMSRRLAAKFKTIDALLAASIDDLKTVEGISVEKATLISSELKMNIGLIAKLKTKNVEALLTNTVKAVSKPQVLVGQKIVVTGTVEGYGRTEMSDLIESLGGTVSSSVSKNTSFVLAGVNPGGSKFDKAKQLGVPMKDANKWVQKYGAL